MTAQQHWNMTDPVFRDTYWGSGSVDQEYDFAPIYKNRMAFLSKFPGIHIPTNTPDRIDDFVKDFENKYGLQYADHIEIYKVRNFGHLIISSSYNIKPADKLPPGWFKLKKMYNPSATTIGTWIPPENVFSRFTEK